MEIGNRNLEKRERHRHRQEKQQTEVTLTIVTVWSASCSSTIHSIYSVVCLVSPTSDSMIGTDIHAIQDWFLS